MSSWLSPPSTTVATTTESTTAESTTTEPASRTVEAVIAFKLRSSAWLSATKRTVITALGTLFELR